MKKIIIIGLLIGILFISGCGNMTDTLMKMPCEDLIEYEKSPYDFYCRSNYFEGKYGSGCLPSEEKCYCAEREGANFDENKELAREIIEIKGCSED